jgi:hypothetical protein
MRTHTTRLTAFGGGAGGLHGYYTDDVIEEERDMSNLDIAAAIRMRKEAKAGKRAMAAAASASSRRRSRTRVPRDVFPRQQEADEGNHADMED